MLDDVVKPLQDELEAMLAQRQQRLLLTDIENETVVSGDATLIRVILRIWWRMLTATALKGRRSACR